MESLPLSVVVVITETHRLHRVHHWVLWWWSQRPTAYRVHHWVLWWWLQRPTAYTESTIECYGDDYRDPPLTQSPPLSAMVVITETHRLHRVHHWVLWWWLQRPTAYTEFTIECYGGDYRDPLRTEFTIECYGGDYRDPLRTQSSPLSAMVVITETHRLHRVHHWVLWWWLQRPTAYTESTIECYGGDYSDPPLTLNPTIECHGGDCRGTTLTQRAESTDRNLLQQELASFLNKTRLKYNGWHFAGDIFESFSWKEISAFWW